ncbi:MAG: tRNA epoxyqueuosine(34) reductase QueG [Armatimonadetes bacterium]|nr:tRNA epoxyqueuosine(34) reductase QueG [Armatimonadota bacterium]
MADPVPEPTIGLAMDIRQELARFANELGFELVGVCRPEPMAGLSHVRLWVQEGWHGDMAFMESSLELREDLENVLPGVRSVIAVGLNYYQELEPEPGTPKLARYALGRDYHKLMRSKLRKLGRDLSENFPSVRFRPCVDSAPTLDRELAQRAGLGWFGKNTCLINSQRGSWFLIGLLLTTADIDPDPPAIGSCGTCRACIDACPTGAIKMLNGRWSVDSRVCISALTIENKTATVDALVATTDGWTFGCDICQEVCPFNQPRESQPLRAQVTREQDFLDRRVWPTLVRIAQWTESDWDTATEGSAARRAKVEQWRRNARANLRQAGITEPCEPLLPEERDS